MALQHCLLSINSRDIRLSTKLLLDILPKMVPIKVSGSGLYTNMLRRGIFKPEWLAVIKLIQMSRTWCNSVQLKGLCDKWPA